MKWLYDVGRVMQREFSLTFKDLGAVIFFFLLPFAYPIVYTLIYNPEVVTDVPVAVVDDCRSADSREFIQLASASPGIKIYDYVPNMEDARRLWAEQKIYGVIHIPADYSKRLVSPDQAHIELYADMSLLLRYRALLSSSTDLQLKLAGDYAALKIESMGAESLAGASSMPIQSNSHFLGDTQQGFASFVIPGIVVLILQQSMILGICLLGGTARQRRRQNGGIDPLAINDASPSATIVGRALTYTILYIPSTIYVLHYIPTMFSLPHYGSAVDYLLFIFPMLLASAFMGQAAVSLIREREYAFLVVVFTSIIFLFLSGLTWPRYAMNTFWTAISDLIPGTWGVEGFVRINSNGATLAESARPYIWLWVLTAFYAILAYLTTRLELPRHRTPSPENPI